MSFGEISLLSLSERNFACSGKSWIIQNDSIPAIIVMAPSRMKIHAHADILATPSILEIAAASKPPYVIMLR